MKLTSVLILMALLIISISVYFIYQPPFERQHLIFNDSAKSVQNSMILLRQICEDIEPQGFINCLVVKRDSILIFRGNNLGKLDSISLFNEGFKGMKSMDIKKLLSTIKFLNRNYISGIYHDTSIGFWLYEYRQDGKYSAINSVRKIYLMDSSKDTLSPSFIYYYTILDRKERMVLLENNDVMYRKFE